MVVFDLDGTLSRVNTHLDVVLKYYHAQLFYSTIGRFIALLFPGIFQRFLDKAYKRIPETFIDRYRICYRSDALVFLQAAKESGESMVVLSSAPQSMLEKVREDLGIPVIYSSIGKKHHVLLREFPEITELTVVTDNITDIELCKMAKKSIIYVSTRSRRMFDKYQLVDAEFRNRRLF